LAEESCEAVRADEAGRECRDFFGFCPLSQMQDGSQKNSASDSDDARKEAKREAEQKPEAPNPSPNWIVGTVPALGHWE